jgi:hypothetical protein
MTVNVERVWLWAEALESEKYRDKQGYGALWRIYPPGIGYSYCCLGVAIEVAFANGVRYTNEDLDDLEEMVRLDIGTDYSQVSDPWELPTRENATLGGWSKVREWYGFDNSDPYVGYIPCADAECSNADCTGGVDANPICATGANDDAFCTFPQIAAMLRKHYPKESTSE